MCNFFSFITTKDNKVLYFDAKQRRDLKNQTILFDSHSSIAEYYLNSSVADDFVNKYEYINGQLIEDQKNISNSIDVNKWILDFSITKEFEEICIEAVKAAPFIIKYIEEQTPEICWQALRHSRYYLEYVKSQTPEMCLSAVRLDGRYLQYVKEQSPEICLAAVKHNKDALKFVNEEYKHLFE